MKNCVKISLSSLIAITLATVFVSTTVFAIDIPFYIGDFVYPVIQDGVLIDSDDTGGDISLIFGNTLNERLYWDSTNSIFDFTDDLNIEGWLGVNRASGTTPASPLHVYQNSASVDATAGATVENEGTGDSLIQFVLTGVQRWVAGIDNSDSDKFKIGYSADLDTDNALTIDTSGNVGLNGNTSPASDLDVTGGDIRANQILAIYDAAVTHPVISAGYLELYVLLDGTNKVTRLLPTDGTVFLDLAMGDWNGGDPDIMLKTGGNVGIAEGAPLNRLDVAGAQVIGDGYAGTNTAPTNGLLVEGDVAIGKTTATVELDVNGTMQQSNAYMFAYDSAGGQTVPTSWTDMTFDNTTRKDDLYTFTPGNAEITLGMAGIYLIEADCGANVSDNTRSHSNWRLMADDGSGYAEIPGSRAYAYHRNSADGYDSIAIHVYVKYDSGAKIKLQGQSDRATQVSTLANSCRIYIERS